MPPQWPRATLLPVTLRVTSWFGKSFTAVSYCIPLRPDRDLERTEIPIYDVKGHGEIINAIDGCGIPYACIADHYLMS